LLTNAKADRLISQSDSGLQKMTSKKKAYYYWLRKFRKEAYEQMQLPAAVTKTEVAFAEVTMPVSATSLETVAQKTSACSPVAVIKCNGLTLELSNAISEVLLNRLLQEVTHA